MQHRSTDGIEDSYHPTVCRDEDLFPIITELQSSPVTAAIEPRLKRGKRTLREEKKTPLMLQIYTVKTGSLIQ